MMANALKLFFAEKAKERQGARTDLKAKANIPRDPAESLLGERREASGQAAAAVVASRDAAQKAAKVQAVAPDLAAQVAAGVLSMSATLSPATSEALSPAA
jgi:hypothetical protein